MKVVRKVDDDKGINLYMGDGSHYYTPDVDKNPIRWMAERASGKTYQVGPRKGEMITCAWVRWLDSKPLRVNKVSPDKEVYFEKKWQPCHFKSQSGMCVTVEHQDHGIIMVPFVHVRDRNPQCEECEQFLWRGSFQSNKGTSYCFNCYRNLDAQSLELLFNGPQWMAWEGQMNMREMDDSHLVNALNRLKKNAATAAEHAGGKPEDFLHPDFEHLVAELHRRRPMEEKIKVNSYLLYVWSILFMIFGTRKHADEDTDAG